MQVFLCILRKRIKSEGRAQVFCLISWFSPVNRGKVSSFRVLYSKELLCLLVAGCNVCCLSEEVVCADTISHRRCLRAAARTEETCVAVKTRGTSAGKQAVSGFKLHQEVDEKGRSGVMQEGQTQLHHGANTQNVVQAKGQSLNIYWGKIYWFYLTNYSYGDTNYIFFKNYFI